MWKVFFEVSLDGAASTFIWPFELRAADGSVHTSVLNAIPRLAEEFPPVLALIMSSPAKERPCQVHTGWLVLTNVVKNPSQPLVAHFKLIPKVQHGLQKSVPKSVCCLCICVMEQNLL